MSNSSSSRRVFLRSLSLAPAALLLVGVSRAGAQDAAPSQCPVDRSDGLPDTLQFRDVAENPAQSCGHCTFWTADATNACGACQMLHRATPTTGHCASFAARDAAQAGH